MVCQSYEIVFTFPRNPVMTRNNARLTDLKNERKSNQMKLQNIPLVFFLVNLYRSKFHFLVSNYFLILDFGKLL